MWRLLEYRSRIEAEISVEELQWLAMKKAERNNKKGEVSNLNLETPRLNIPKKKKKPASACFMRKMDVQPPHIILWNACNVATRSSLRRKAERSHASVTVIGRKGCFAIHLHLFWAGWSQLPKLGVLIASHKWRSEILAFSAIPLARPCQIFVFCD